VVGFFPGRPCHCHHFLDCGKNKKIKALPGMMKKDIPLKGIPGGLRKESIADLPLYNAKEKRVTVKILGDIFIIN